MVQCYALFYKDGGAEPFAVVRARAGHALTYETSEEGRDIVFMGISEREYDLYKKGLRGISVYTEGFCRGWALYLGDKEEGGILLCCVRLLYESVCDWTVMDRDIYVYAL